MAVTWERSQGGTRRRGRGLVGFVAAVVLWAIPSVGCRDREDSSRESKTVLNGLGCDPAIDAARPAHLLEHDAGDVVENSHLAHTFSVANKSTRPLTIADVKHSCSCTVATFATRTIQPGMAVEVPVRVNIGSSSGPAAQVVELLPSAAELPVIRLRLSYNVVKPPWQVMPQEVRFGRQIVGTRAEKKVSIRAGRKGSRLVSAEAGGAWHSVKLAAGQPGDWQLSVTLLPTARAGLLSDKIVLRTDDPKFPSITVDASATVMPNSYAQPGVVSWGLVGAGKPIGTEIVIREHESRSTQIVKQSASCRHIRLVGLSLARDGSAPAIHRVRAELAPAAALAAGLHRETITFTTSDPLTPTVVVPVTFFVTHDPPVEAAADAGRSIVACEEPS